MLQEINLIFCRECIIVLVGQQKWRVVSHHSTVAMLVVSKYMKIHLENNCKLMTIDKIDYHKSSYTNTVIFRMQLCFISLNIASIFFFKDRVQVCALMALKFHPKKFLHFTWMFIDFWMNFVCEYISWVRDLNLHLVNFFDLYQHFETWWWFVVISYRSGSIFFYNELWSLFYKANKSLNWSCLFFFNSGDTYPFRIRTGSRRSVLSDASKEEGPGMISFKFGHVFLYVDFVSLKV